MSVPAPPAAVARTVYVPVYSSIYWGASDTVVDLGVTVSVRNVSSQSPIVVNSARYYDSTGKPVRDYVSAPGQLDPLASVEFVIQAADTAGGAGASFLVQWTGPADVDDPVIEAVMIGQAGNAGLAFTSPGKVLQRARDVRP